MKVFIGVLIVLVVLTLAEGGNRWVKKCNKMYERFEGCLDKGYIGGKMWRDDMKCGPKNPLYNGDPAQCNPDHPEGKSCCNPEGEGWCGNTPGHCSCDTCIDFSTPDDCVDKADEDGSDYRGTASVTASGHVCQRWDSQSPKAHSVIPENYPDAGLQENYCRNPDGSPGAWCFNAEESGPRWEYCDKPIICGESVESEPEEAKLSKKELRKCARVERNLWKKCP